MAEQGASTVDGAGNADAIVAAYDPAHLHHNPGRPISWVGTAITTVGFIVGGIAFPIQNPGPNWIVFWIGAAIAIFGILVLAFSKAIDTDWY
jgi:MFS family permease